MEIKIKKYKIVQYITEVKKHNHKFGWKLYLIEAMLDYLSEDDYAIVDEDTFTILGMMYPIHQVRNLTLQIDDVNKFEGWLSENKLKPIEILVKDDKCFVWYDDMHLFMMYNTDCNFERKD